MKLYYHHVGVAGATEDFKKTVFGAVPLSLVKNNVGDGNPNKPEMLRVLRSNFPDGKLNCWGVPSGAGYAINNLNEGDAVLLVETTRGEGRVPALCVVVGFWKDELRELSKALWGNDRFPYIFFFRTESLSLTWRQMLSHFGYKPNFRPQGNFYPVADVKLSAFGGAGRYVEYLRANYAGPADPLTAVTPDDVKKEVGVVSDRYVKEVAREVSAIKQNSSTETPKLVEGKAKKIKEVAERPRSAAFRVSVKKLYKFRCAICGVGLVAPDGTPAVESAHIYPKEKDGSDDFRNGICLCRMHHWAFDAGWLAIADDYSIILHKDLPPAEEYDFIREYEGREVTLPEQTEFAPHRLFLRAHRELKGFES